MKTIHLHLLSIAMLLVTALPSMAQSARLDSLQRVNADILQQSEALQLQFDSLYRIIAACKTDPERLVQYEVLDKFKKKNIQISNKLRKVEDEIKVEEARLEQLKRDSILAVKQARAQALSPVPLKGELNGHQWVDLGLPSGTKWATCNVGTTKIHGVGTRVAWGEIAPKKLYSPETCQYNDTLMPSIYGDPQYDLATAQWGEGWYTPTLQQWNELIEYCDWNYVMINAVHGVIFTSRKTYNTIFLPSTGYTDDQNYKLKYTTYNQAYWSSTGLRNDGAHTYIANYEQGYMSTSYRYVGRCVRAVCGTGAVAEAVQDVAAVVEGIQAAVEHDVTTLKEDTTTVQQEPKTKKNKKSAQETIKDVQKTVEVVNKTAKTLKTLHNIFH